MGPAWPPSAEARELGCGQQGSKGAVILRGGRILADHIERMKSERKAACVRGEAKP